MVNYICQRCGYETYHKSVFKKHLTRKKLCEPKLEELTKEELLYLNNMNKDKNNSEKSSKSNSFKSSKSNSKSSVSKKFKCKYCDKSYKYKQGRWKHEQSCKNKENVDNKIIQNVYLRLEKIEKEYKNMVEENKKLKKQLENVSSKPSINRGTINNANNQCNIIINNFGEEQIKYISDKTFKKLLSTPISAIPKLIELKHFNPDHPENHNIKITNIHDKYAKIYKDRKWLTQHKKDVIQELVDNGFADFEEFRDLNDEQITQKIREKYKKMEENYTNNIEKIKEKSLLTTINGTDKLGINIDV
jgi:hypothetical protein